MLDAQTFTRNTYRVLKVTYGGVPIVAGLDKFANLLVDWSTYLSPWAAGALPFSAKTFMMVVGVIEIAAGAVVLSKWTRYGAWIVAAWLVCIALNLLTTGHYDVAVRDLVMAVGAYHLARAAEVVGAGEAATSRTGALAGRPA